MAIVPLPMMAHPDSRECSLITACSRSSENFLADRRKSSKKGNSHDVWDILKILVGEISIHVPVRSVPIDRIPTCTETLSHHLSSMQRTKKVSSSIRTFKSGIGMRKT